MGGSLEEGSPPSLVKSWDLRAITCKQPRHNIKVQIAAALPKTSILTPAFTAATVKHTTHN